ncbi:SDR family oxidoreductase, partial [Burkholderia gladioli]|nr:SDR family oxidoreductase [Burkholderia gladioli]
AGGYRVALMSPSGSAVELAAELGGFGIAGSVTEDADIGRFVDETLARYGRIDAVVNNTGHPPKGDLLAIGDEQWHLGLDLVVLNVARVLRERLGTRRLDILFVNAGIARSIGLTPGNAPEADFLEMMRVNAFSAVRRIEGLEDGVKPDGTVAIMSSELASIANSPGGWDLY